MKNFEHLKFHKIIVEKARFNGGGNVSPKTIENRNNRINHSNYLKSCIDNICNNRANLSQERVKHGFNPLPLEMPLLLKLDEESFPIQDLYKYGLEVVAEDKDGFVVVATDEAGLAKFIKILENFKLTTASGQSIRGTGKVAEIHEISNEDLPSKRLSEYLYTLWPFDTNKEYTVDLSIECKGNEPFHISEQRKTETEQEYLLRVEQEKLNLYAKLDAFIDAREQNFKEFVSTYTEQCNIIGERITDSYDLNEPPECFDIRLRAYGNVINDVVLNYPYLFEINEPDDICCFQTDDITENNETEFNVLAPDDNSAVVCVIDSGIQEGHKYISPAILEHYSKSYIDTDSCLDEYLPYGHGTRVAGKILYPNGFDIQDDYQLPCWLCNAKILDENNCIPENKLPAGLIKEIVNDNKNRTKLFNHSITSFSPCRKKHMSSWAAEMDLLSYKNDILFIQAAGNIHKETSTSIPYNGIKNYLDSGKTYPEYLYDEPSSRIANPAQSMFALTVGSIAHNAYTNLITGEVSIEQEHYPSSFTRCGLGMWGCIKPDVVEYGGGYIKTSDNILKQKEETSLDALCISPPGPSHAKDAVGTSFSTPKVTYIASQIQKEFPEQSALFYRALIAHSAQWPQWTQNTPNEAKLNVLKMIGYGLPNLENALQNNDYKVTFITNNMTEIIPKQAHMYYIPIPEKLRTAAEDSEIKITVTLAYAAKPRRTRMKKGGYLSSWLEWDTCKPDEEIENFQARIFKVNTQAEEYRNEPWFLGTNREHGVIRGISRNDSTLQKDWRIIKSHQLPEKFGIAVKSHKGWDNDPFTKAYYSLIVTLEAINNDLKIYNDIKLELESEIEIETQNRIRL